jgi:hypothetical protein
MVRFGTKGDRTVRRSHEETRRREHDKSVNFALRRTTTIVSRPQPSQTIRIVRALLLVILSCAAGCSGDDVAWTDPLTLSSAGADGHVVVDSKGRARLLPDTSVSVVPEQDRRACPGSVRIARQDDGTLAAVWWSVRDDSSSLLLAAVSPDGGTSWRPALRVDTADVSIAGCNRPPAAIAASGGFLHLAYAMRGAEGVGVFYAHSMNAGKSYEAPVTILYGDRLTRTAIAAERATVAIAYEDPSGSTPQVGLALSRDWGHIFGDRIRGSTGVGPATDPQVAVTGREVAVSWIVSSGGGDSDARPTRIVRVGRLQ